MSGPLAVGLPKLPRNDPNGGKPYQQNFYREEKVAGSRSGGGRCRIRTCDLRYVRPAL
jgi:hypothetical protein